MRYFPEAIDLMRNSQPGVAMQHTWAGISHDLFGLSFVSRLEAVNGAVRACRLVVSVRAFPEPHINIVHKVLTRCAQNAIGSVMVTRAVDADHLCDGQTFTSKVFHF
jgi:hypothetical protein